MPRYEYRCRACGDTFERSRPMSESSAPCPCPQGHDDTVRLLSTISVAAGPAMPVRRLAVAVAAAAAAPAVAASLRGCG